MTAGTAREAGVSGNPGEWYNTPMPRPRFQFSIRWMMVAVGLVALLAFARWSHDRTPRHEQLRAENELERQRRLQWQFNETINFHDGPGGL